MGEQCLDLFGGVPRELGFDESKLFFGERADLSGVNRDKERVPEFERVIDRVVRSIRESHGGGVALPFINEDLALGCIPGIGRTVVIAHCDGKGDPG